MKRQLLEWRQGGGSEDTSSGTCTKYGNLNGNRSRVRECEPPKGTCVGTWYGLENATDHKNMLEIVEILSLNT